MITSLIGIGSNMGDRKAYINKAIEMLNKSYGIKVEDISNLYETDPVGGPPQGKFLNGAIRISTELSPRELLNRLQGIEDNLGRERQEKNGPRTIDLDILTYGGLHIEEEDLVIPHPRMDKRDFVMRPLRDLLKTA